LSFNEQQLTDNAHALIADLIAKKPSTAKGIYVRSVTVSSTMGPGVRVDTATVEAPKREEG
jgi:large subunit ribosomal protein L1